MKPQTPTTYDEITRRTVPNPDGSFRPSPEQVAASSYGGDVDTESPRLMSPDEQALYARVCGVLLAANDTHLGDVHVEVDGTRVILRGAVGDAARLARAEELVKAIDGVNGVVNQLSPVAKPTAH
jgi:hypothetical protein